MLFICNRWLCRPASSYIIFHTFLQYFNVSIIFSKSNKVTAHWFSPRMDESLACWKQNIKKCWLLHSTVMTIYTYTYIWGRDQHPLCCPRILPHALNAVMLPEIPRRHSQPLLEHTGVIMYKKCKAIKRRMIWLTDKASYQVQMNSGGVKESFNCWLRSVKAV